MWWNFFLKQIQQAHQLKLSIQIYTNTPQTDKYHLTKEVWSTMEYMEPILQMFNHACNVFQSKAPSKHLVLPYYQVILNRLTHYASNSPHLWRQACEAAHAKLKKYYDFEMANNNSLIETLLNPKYCKGIFKQMGVPPHQAKEVINILAWECSTLAQNKQSGQVTGDQQSSSDNLSEPETFNLLKHLKQPPMKTMYDVLHSQDDEVTPYLQNTHPMTKGKHILDYWKHQIMSWNFPNLGKVALRYLSLPAASASVERLKRFSDTAYLAQTMTTKYFLAQRRCAPNSRSGISPFFLIFFLSASIFHLQQCAFSKNSSIERDLIDAEARTESSQTNFRGSLRARRNPNRDLYGKRNDRLLSLIVTRITRKKQKELSKHKARIKALNTSENNFHKNTLPTGHCLIENVTWQQDRIIESQNSPDRLLEAAYIFIYPLVLLNLHTSSIQEVTNPAELALLFTSLKKAYGEDAESAMEAIQFIKTLHDETLRLNCKIIYSLGQRLSSSVAKAEQRALSNFFCNRLLSAESRETILAPKTSRQVLVKNPQGSGEGISKESGEKFNWEIIGTYASWPTVQVNNNQITRIEIAMRLIELYFKKANEEKWNIIFEKEAAFISFVTKISLRYKNRNLSPWYDANKKNLRKNPLLPWKNDFKKDEGSIELIRKVFFPHKFTIYSTSFEVSVSQSIRKTDQWIHSPILNRALKQKLIQYYDAKKELQIQAGAKWSSQDSNPGHIPKDPHPLPKLLIAEDLLDEAESVTKPCQVDPFYEMIHSFGLRKPQRKELQLPDLPKSPVFSAPEIVSQTTLEDLYITNEALKELHKFMMNFSLRILLVFNVRASADVLGAELGAITEKFSSKLHSSKELKTAILYPEAYSESDLENLLSPLERAILSYLRTAGIPLSKKDIENLDSPAAFQVWKQELAQVEIAVNLFILHYKQVNPDKWEAIFARDEEFLLFLHITNRKSRNVAAWKDIIRGTLRNRALLPWKDALTLDEDKLMGLKKLYLGRSYYTQKAQLLKVLTY
ncbi:hypothetical protein O181_049451 [Austropuccinia psidii MF-1]|uniref:HAT C-terminal dimerisation domain-containing protein n=1 Tax=Austropuccinia psidii MF-1 TaxID=1389203 RepID=A0A9Q3DZX9_9BASI|nr:hypothetical protein [Austropuccinia psidii MF-1]